jgi:hypothetical protein
MEHEYLMSAEFEAFVELVTAGAEETTSLEFKRKPSPGTELQRADKKLLGEAVSAFANATGGILIIGIGTEEHEGIDRAKEIVEVEDVEAVAVRYRAYITSCTAPPVEGVSVRAVHTASGAGVMAISVPQGQARPHMSRAPDHHKYFRRVMDKCIPMEAYEVEEMMRLKTAPKLELVTSLHLAGSIGDNRQFELRFGLANRSRVTAKYPYIEYLRQPNAPALARYGLDGNGGTLWKQLPAGFSSGGVIFAAGADQVIHPGQTMFVSKLEMVEEFDARFQRDWGLTKLADGEVVELHFEFGCEDCPKEVAQVQFTKEELADFVRPDRAH